MIKLEHALALRARSGAPPRRARRHRSSRMPSGCASGCGSPMPNTSGSRRWRTAGGGFRARGRAACARVLLYRLGPERFTDRVLLAWCALADEGAADAHWHELATLAGALDRAGVSAQGRRLHRARRRQGPGARRGDARGRGGVDRGGFSDRRRRARRHRRCRGAGGLAPHSVWIECVEIDRSTVAQRTRCRPSPLWGRVAGGVGVGVLAKQTPPRGLASLNRDPPPRGRVKEGAASLSTHRRAIPIPWDRRPNSLRSPPHEIEWPRDVP